MQQHKQIVNLHFQTEKQINQPMESLQISYIYWFGKCLQNIKEKNKVAKQQIP